VFLSHSPLWPAPHRVQRRGRQQEIDRISPDVLLSSPLSGNVSKKRTLAFTRSFRPKYHNSINYMLGSPIQRKSFNGDKKQTFFAKKNYFIYHDLKYDDYL
jgi:hypothetical protein